LSLGVCLNAAGSTDENPPTRFSTPLSSYWIVAMCGVEKASGKAANCCYLAMKISIRLNLAGNKATVAKAPGRNVTNLLFLPNWLQKF
jgi:hypothetical protein